ncbi:hypothetical protein QBC46DRAFT_417452 [Diplogelasinospora grovesii]|uniref:Uncharacterized protein n=1 Tax=Diplogelasinospora grovesii TaxID=303347 RepID=A0AAN6N378_9PEZI|nr:hypothetical protein QBC46DRAFT_417452 [Diplogelasinospora grovesii]
MPPFSSRTLSHCHRTAILVSILIIWVSPSKPIAPPFTMSGNDKRSQAPPNSPGPSSGPPGSTPNPRDRASGQPEHDGTSTTTNNVNAKERSHSAEDPPPEEPPRPEIPNLGTGTVGDPEPIALPPSEEQFAPPADEAAAKSTKTADSNDHSLPNDCVSLDQVFVGYPTLDCDFKF